jgi:sialic acid synthase SpsE
MRYPYIIAEAGSCHEGQVERALSLVYMAKHADADAVKFQYWSSPERMRERRHTGWPAYEQGSVKAEWFPLLHKVAKDIGLDFMCTAYLPEDVAEVAKWVDMFKVSSFENQDRDFLREHVGYGKPMVVSLGMGGTFVYTGEVPTYYLACTSAYPCPPEEAALRAVWGVHGYSDHTRLALTGALAVAAGAKILEVHFRLEDTKPECPDYCVALSPTELGEYVEGARLAALMYGTGEWAEKPDVQPSEVVNLKHRVMS